MLKSFRTDPKFLLRYYISSTLVLLGLVVALALFPLHSFALGAGLWLVLLLPLLINSILALIAAFILILVAFSLSTHSISYAELLFIPTGIYLGMINVQLIHNCAHKSFRPRWLNRPLGELLAVHMLSGFPGFVILHLSHHQNPDDPLLDPHPNGDLTFWQYFVSVKGMLKNYFKRTYLQQWGNSVESEKTWAQVQQLLRLNRFLRAALLLLVFGPVGFTLCLLPSFLSNHLTFAHINYFSHAKQPDGSVKILNLEHGFFAFLNMIMLGGYSHSKHHTAPHLFNPSSLESSGENAS